MSEFGANFKRARESRGISLDQIAVETRISTRFLQAIENEEFHLLPGGIFNRGFIRNYAERVGLDAEQAVADYERLSGYREPAEVLSSTTRQSDKAPRRLYPIIIIGALALLIFIFYAARPDSGDSATGGQTRSIVAPAVPAPPPPAEPAPTQPQPSPVENTGQPEESPPVSAVPKLETLTVEMEIREDTWIRLVTDGQEVLSEILKPGTTLRYIAQESIDIKVGNAGGLVLKVNDREVPSLGRSGQVVQFNITPKNVKDIFG